MRPTLDAVYSGLLRSVNNFLLFAAEEPAFPVQTSKSVFEMARIRDVLDQVIF